jgi:transaldolase
LFELLDTIADLERTLKALVDHGVIVGDYITGTAADAQRLLEKVRAVGVDLEDVFGVLETDGVVKFAASWRRLLDAYPTSAVPAENAQGRGGPDR